MLDSSAPWEEFQKEFRLSHLLIRGLIKGLSPDKANFSTFPVEM